MPRSRQDRAPVRVQKDFDVDYSAEAFHEDLSRITTMTAALESGRGGEELRAMLERYREKHDEDVPTRDFVALMHFRSAYGSDGFNRFVRFNVVYDTLVGYLSLMTERGLVGSQDAGGLVRAQMPVEVLRGLLQAPIVDTGRGLCIPKQHVMQVLDDAEREADS